MPVMDIGHKVRLVEDEEYIEMFNEHWIVSLSLERATCDKCGKVCYSTEFGDELTGWSHHSRFTSFSGKCNPVDVVKDVFRRKGTFYGNRWMGSMTFCPSCQESMVPWFKRMADICLVIYEVNRLERAIKRRIKDGHQDNWGIENRSGKRGQKCSERRP